MLEDVLKQCDAMSNKTFTDHAAPKTSKSKQYNLQTQADARRFDYPLPSRLRRGTSQQDIDTSVLGLEEHSQNSSEPTNAGTETETNKKASFSA